MRAFTSACARRCAASFASAAAAASRRSPASSVRRAARRQLQSARRKMPCFATLKNSRAPRRRSPSAAAARADRAAATRSARHAIAVRQRASLRARRAAPRARRSARSAVRRAACAKPTHASRAERCLDSGMRRMARHIVTQPASRCFCSRQRSTALVCQRQMCVCIFVAIWRFRPCRTAMARRRRRLTSPASCRQRRTARLHRPRPKTPMVAERLSAPAPVSPKQRPSATFTAVRRVASRLHTRHALLRCRRLCSRSSRSSAPCAASRRGTKRFCTDASVNAAIDASLVCERQRSSMRRAVSASERSMRRCAPRMSRRRDAATARSSASATLARPARRAASIAARMSVACARATRLAQWRTAVAQATVTRRKHADCSSRSAAPRRTALELSRTSRACASRSAWSALRRQRLSARPSADSRNCPATLAMRNT